MGGRASRGRGGTRTEKGTRRVGEGGGGSRLAVCGDAPRGNDRADNGAHASHEGKEGPAPASSDGCAAGSGAYART